LRNSSDPWKLVEENWDKTVHVRLNKIASKQGQSIVEYMTVSCFEKTNWLSSCKYGVKYYIS